MNCLDSEPLIFAIGDALWFRKHLPEFPVEKGFYLEYQGFSENGAVAIPLFRSVLNAAFPNQASHEIKQNPFAANVAPGLIKLVGFVTDGVFRHEIYNAWLTLTPNFALNQAQGDQVPYELQMVRIYQDTLKALAQHAIVESDMVKIKWIKEKRAEITTELFKWEEKYNHYLKGQAIRSGRPDPTLIRPVFDWM